MQMLQSFFFGDRLCRIFQPHATYGACDGSRWVWFCCCCLVGYLEMIQNTFLKKNPVKEIFLGKLKLVF